MSNAKLLHCRQAGYLGFFICYLMVWRASLAYHWNGEPNHPEQASESERVEGSSLFE
ncbi:MAG: hypothetical protein KAS66_04165 [Candidatus Omnitrophica bacterium]|nr:hypothetical protein [Candidatus Omnitrophota bacterium]